MVGAKSIDSGQIRLIAQNVYKFVCAMFRTYFHFCQNWSLFSCQCANEQAIQVYPSGMKILQKIDFLIYIYPTVVWINLSLVH